MIRHAQNENKQTNKRKGRKELENVLKVAPPGVKPETSRTQSDTNSPLVIKSQERYLFCQLLAVVQTIIFVFLKYQSKRANKQISKQVLLDEANFLDISF